MQRVREEAEKAKKVNGNFMSNRYGRNGSDVHAARQILRA
jgi:hypothetical protein